MAANYVFTFQTADVLVCGAPATSIHAVQGAGPVSPLVGTGVTIEGIVVGDYQGRRTSSVASTSRRRPPTPTRIASTSEGVFVFDNGLGVAVQPGDLVRVRGTVTEFNGLTEIGAVSGVRGLLDRQPSAGGHAGQPAGPEGHGPRGVRGDARPLRPDADRDRGLQPRPLRRGQPVGRRPALHADRRRRPRAARPGGDRPEQPQPDHPRRRQQPARTSTRPATRRAASRRATRCASATRCRA